MNAFLSGVMGDEALEGLRQVAEEKRARAIAQLGTKYAHHPANHVRSQQQVVAHEKALQFHREMAGMTPLRLHKFYPG
ncbi:MAG TPA: hypothetical protein VF681_13340 [Abditibacteriaceae bacterium]|jgi:hypothetical protein